MSAQEISLIRELAQIRKEYKESWSTKNLMAMSCRHAHSFPC